MLFPSTCKNSTEQQHKHRSKNLSFTPIFSPDCLKQDSICKLYKNSTEAKKMHVA